MKITRIVIALFGLLLLISFANKNLSNIRLKTLQGAKPAFKFTNQIFKKASFTLRSKDSKTTENLKLKTKVKILEARLAGMKELSLENERLKRLLIFRGRTAYKTIPAQVIGHDPSNWANIVYIDKGRNDGITPKMAITTDEGLAGKVMEAGEFLSRVMLINDPDSRIAVLVQRSREQALLCGTLSKRCRMIYISPDADVKPGDLVVTLGSGKTFPKGLLIGRIVDVFEDMGGLYRSAIIKPAADLQRLEEVLCIK